MADEEGRLPPFSVKKKRNKKQKIQNFVAGRTRRRINSESSSTLSETRARFIRPSSVSTKKGICAVYTLTKISNLGISRNSVNLLCNLLNLLF